MTIATEPNSGDPAGMRIGTSVTDITGRSRIGMPFALVVEHEPSWMRPRVRTFDPVRIDVTPDAHRIRSLCVMTRRAALDVPFGHRCVKTSTGPDSDQRKVCLLVACGPERHLIHVAAGGVTLSAELLRGMTGCTLLGFGGGDDPVRIAEVKVVHLFERQPLATVNGEEPR